MIFKTRASPFRKGSFIFKSRPLLTQFADQLGHAPDDHGEAVEEQEVADHEQGVGYLLHRAQKGELGGVVGGDIEHTEIIPGLAGGGVEVEMVHQDIAHDGQGDEAQKHDGGGDHLAEVLAVAAGDDEIDAHDHQDRVPQHGVEGHGDEVGVQHRRGDRHDRQTADDAEEGQESVAKLTGLFRGDERGGDGHVDGHRAELVGEDLEAVVAVELEPEELLEDLATDENDGEDPDHDAVVLGAVLAGYGQTQDDTGGDHNAKPKKMKPAEHTGADVAVVDVSPGPIEHCLHCFYLAFVYSGHKLM